MLNWRRAAHKEPDSDGLVYFAVVKDNLLKLNVALRKIRDNAAEDFQMNGLRLPWMPTWGFAGSIDQWYNRNDTECMAACFRVEVERFLSLVLAQQPKSSRKSTRERSSIVPDDKEGRVRDHGSISQVLRNKDKQWDNLRGKTRSFLQPTISAYTPSRCFAEDMVDPKRPTSFQRNTRDRPPHVVSSTPSKGEERKRSDTGLRQHGRNNGGPPSDDSDSSDNSNRGGPPNRDRGAHRRNSQSPIRHRPRGNGDPDDPDDEPSDGSNGGNGGNRCNFNRDRNLRNQENIKGTTDEPRFDNKLKPESIPTWDGDMNSIIRWEVQINAIAKRSPIIFKQLGQLVPTRLRDNAEIWYYSQSEKRQDQLEEDWDTLRSGINAYYMNRTWMDDQKSTANKASFREPRFSKESPSEYFICKKDLLTHVYEYNDTQLICEIMEGAPTSWINVVTPHLYDELDEFQGVIRFHEKDLSRLSYRSYKNYDNQNNYSQPGNPNSFERRAHLVGSSPNLPPPQFLKDDSNISKRRTPEDKGARPCRHCGSGKHWDNECKYSRRGIRKARMNHIETTTTEDKEAQQEYDDLYYGLSSDEDSDF